MARHPRTQLRTTPPNFQPSELDISTAQLGFNLSGEDTESMLNEMEPGYCRLVKNFSIRLNAYEIRPGSSVIGTASASQMVGVHDVPLSTEVNKLVRWRTDGVDVWSGAAWVAAGGAAWTGTQLKPFAITGWADTVIFTCGIGKLFQLSFGPDVLTELTDSPTDVIHLATFGSRVIATTREGIYWTVKADSTDWSGLGSGFEDLKSAPDGVSDLPTAVVPITDEFAGHIRSKSVWQMSLTGDFDAPFSFSKMPMKAGSLYPMTCKSVGKGVACVGEQGAVWLITTESATDVGSRVRSIIATPEEQGIGKYFSAAFDSRFNEYRIIVNYLGAQRILRYNIDAQAWTEDSYAFPIQYMSYTDFASLPSPVTGKYKAGFLYVMDGPAFIVREDPDATDDITQLNVPSPIDFRIETGHIRKTDDSLIKDFYELVLWYQAQHAAILKFYYSDDEGTTWTHWLDMNATATGKVVPHSLTVPTISRDSIMLAVVCNSIYGFRMNKMEVWMRESGRRVDAS